jgi:hypothetical protein
MQFDPISMAWLSAVSCGEDNPKRAFLRDLVRAQFRAAAKGVRCAPDELARIWTGTSQPLEIFARTERAKAFLRDLVVSVSVDPEAYSSSKSIAVTLLANDVHCITCVEMRDFPESVGAPTFRGFRCAV